MRNKIIILILLFTLKVNLVVATENIKFEAEKINTFENGNIIIGENKAKAEISGNYIINGNKFTFYKLKNELHVEGDVLIFDETKSLELLSKKIIYQKEFSKISAYENVIVNDKKNKTIINSNNIEFNIQNNEYESFGKTKINFDELYSIFSNGIKYNPN